MALGKVTVNNLNLFQGPITAIERTFLFIGPAPQRHGDVLSINSQTELDTLLGEADSDLKSQLIAAKANGGQHWSAYAVPLAEGGTWQDAFELAMEQKVSPEAVVITTPVANQTDLQAMYAASLSAINEHGRRMIFMATTPGITSEQTWSQYLASQKALVISVAAPRVCVVPQLHGNNVGVLAGRLCNSSVSIADSPMRVATGPLVGLGPVPKDKEGMALPSVMITELDKIRLSVPQTYPDYPGTYWGDASLLEQPGGDYQVIEHLRIVDKAARQIRLLAISKIADRSLNNTDLSIACNKNYFMTPLRQMSKSVRFMGRIFPNEIHQPTDSDIEIIWKSKTDVEIYLSLKPYNAPKSITVNIALDLSNKEDK
ncbi:DUF2586 family protein [Zooshikella marina]|uniref:DUF2586 domain-containing protein n=2 Tax=Zooshikella ganghwensis TaxID=202772 RepID=UPI001BAEE065|nr:DUF2586 domain-containing protein [Zooshikella ganghwensis]MBU2707707.1 DUF2586 family protein [Zooshikella ganghwensis]